MVLVAPVDFHCATAVAAAAGGHDPMKFVAVHPSPLMYNKIYLRLESLGLELVAQTAWQAGHNVYLI